MFNIKINLKLLKVCNQPQTLKNKMENVLLNLTTRNQACQLRPTSTFILASNMVYFQSSLLCISYSNYYRWRSQLVHKMRGKSNQTAAESKGQSGPPRQDEFIEFEPWFETRRRSDSVISEMKEVTGGEATKGEENWKLKKVRGQWVEVSKIKKDETETEREKSDENWERKEKNDLHPIQHLFLHIKNHTIIMIKILIISFAILGCLSDSVPCTETQESIFASISDCSAEKYDQYTLSWGVKIDFKKEVEHRSDNWINLLSDNVHPRLPYFPLGGECKSEYGTFESGQSVLLNCTQDFEDIPKDYVNSVILLEDS